MPLDTSPASHALQTRYAAQQPAPPAWNATIDGMMQHCSVRSYLPDSLPEGTIELLVAAASSAATSSNMQMWSVVAVQDPARRARLAVMAGNQQHINEAPLFLLWLADLSRAERIGQAKGRVMEGLPYLETFMVAAIDAALAAQNAVVAAESLGLGTVYIGSMRNDPVAVAAELGLPEQCMVVFGLCVGTPDPARPSFVKPRLPPAVVLHHERYDASSEAAEIAQYDTAFADFQASQKLPHVGWSARVLERLGAIAGLAGRERMRGWLAALGFPLS